MGLAHLSIGTATERIDLLNPTAWHAGDWRPQAGDVLTTFRESALADLRQPASYREMTTIETIPLTLLRRSQDQNVRAAQDLRRMLRHALNYWVSKWQNEVVYLQAQASCETNMRYAWVYEARVPEDANPFRRPFAGPGRRSVMPDEMLVLERGPWLSARPGTGELVLIEGAEYWCFPSYLNFDGIDDSVNCGVDAKLNNLPDFAVSGKGLITVEAVIRPDGWGENGGGRIADKTNWGFHVLDTGGLQAFVTCAGRQGRSTCGLDDFTIDGAWHHVLMTYSETGAGLPAARTVYIATDGVWAPDYDFQQTSQGNYLVDGGQNLNIGDNTASNRCFEGDIGWVRVSNSIRHSPGAGNFTPPARCTLPQIDGNTVGQWIKEGEGSGAGAVANQSGGTAGNLVGAIWGCDCPELFGYVPPVGGAPAAPWWDPDAEGLCVWGAWQAVDAANFAASLLDLTGNAHNLTDPGGAATPGWDANRGWIFVGAADWLSTTFIPQNDQSQTMLCQFRNWVDIAGNNYLAGCYTAGNSYFTLAPDNGNIVFVGNGQNRWVFGIPFANGNLGVAGNEGYKNGAAIGAITGYTVAPVFPVYVGCFNNNGAGPAGYADVYIRAFVIYDCVLTPAQMAKVATAMAAL